MIDTLRLTAEDARGMLERGEVSPAELRAAYREAIDSAQRGAALLPDARRRGRERRRPDRAQGRHLDEGRRDDGRLEDPRGVRPGLRLDGRGALQGRRPAAARQDEHGRVRDGLVDGELRVRPERNPWDPERVPGGSGGGSAAAVSAGLAPWALGSDTGGSIKQPSALCGNVGLRPTYGTVSRYGIVAFASSLDQVGPVTKTVRDNALLYGIISGRDECDSTTVDVPHVELPEAEDLKGLRVGVPKELNEAEGIEPGVAEAVRRAIDLCTELGAEVGECELPRSVEYGLPCYYLIAPAEASSNLARYDGVRYGLRREADDYYEMVDAHARRRLRRRAEAPHHARDVRALGRLLRGVLRPGAEGAHRHQSRSSPTRSSASTSSSARRRRRSRSSSARRPRTRSRCTSPTS